MDAGFYLPENPDYTLRDSAHDSVRFAHRCLEPCDNGRWRAGSSFVDPEGRPQHWHDFGDLEGPGWAANALGGGYQLYSWGGFDHCRLLQHVALGLIDHVLDDGFVQPNGFIWGYRDTARDELCLNFKHNNDWFCPGSMARIGLHMIWAADALPESDERVERLRSGAVRTSEWLKSRVRTVDGWYPRRCTPEGSPYDRSAEGGPDPLFDGSADGLHIVWLAIELLARGLGPSDGIGDVLRLVTSRDGIYGSINHDTYDFDECVARAVAFRVFRRAAQVLGDPEFQRFAYKNALAGLERFEMHEDRNGVATTGLLYMEDSWDTAYLWENAEASLAYLEAHEEFGDPRHLCKAVTILRAIARHHYGELGFLTEGVDWNNHVGREHHIDDAEFGAIRYTEPLLNNLHHIEPVMRYLELQGRCG